LPRFLLATALLLLALPAGARVKDDIVILRNGDHITGEIKSMTRGKLDLSTDDMGRVSVEWDKIERIASSHSYEAELTTGKRFIGPLSSPAAGEISVGLAPDNVVVPFGTVVELIPMEDEFINRVRAIFDLGFTLAKSNWATTLSTSGEFSYRAHDLGVKFNFDGYFQDDANNVAVSRWTIALQGDWLFTERWRAVLGFQADRNDELQLLLRLTIAPGVAHSVVRNGWTELWLTGGLAGSRESYANTDPNLALDLLVGASWDAFRYDTPKLDLNVSFFLMPGLTDFGRLRGTFNLKVKYEIFRDFNVGIAFNDTFDTRPPDPTAPNNDFITSLTIGWSYRR